MWKEAEKYLIILQNIPAYNFHWFPWQVGYQSTSENPTGKLLQTIHKFPSTFEDTASNT